MKTCHQCHETFPDGLTCPNCHAFVPDPFLDDELDDRIGDAATGPAWATPSSETPAAGPAWAVAAPADPGPTDPASTDPAPTASAPPDPAPSTPPEPSTTTTGPDTTPVGPAWAVAAAGPAWAVPTAAPERATRPDPEADGDPAREAGPRREPVVPRTTGTDLEPVSFPAWARPAEEVDALPPALPPAPPPVAPASRPPTGEPPAAGFDHQALFRTTGPVGPVAPIPPKASSPLTPATIAIGLAALVVVLVLGFIVLHPGSKATTAVAPDIAGTCFTYNADRSQIDTTVACDQGHDGTVLAFATDGSRCPSGTDAILTTQSDAAGRNGVLCIREK